ncbi:hypothetical protein BJ742DRAFT_568597 [Cladochytrium replicatum]|nr:hypothetical protein BJ742DRAFT_568597 [Cladochytrium replicatum]
MLGFSFRFSAVNRKLLRSASVVPSLAIRAASHAVVRSSTLPPRPLAVRSFASDATKSKRSNSRPQTSPAQKSSTNPAEPLTPLVAFRRHVDGNRARSAYREYESLKESNELSSLDTDHFNYIIKAINVGQLSRRSRLVRLNSSKRIYDDLVEAKKSPNVETLTLMSRAYSAHGDIPAMESFLESVKGCYGVELPNQILEERFTEAYASNGNLKAAMEHFEKLSALPDVKPTDVNRLAIVLLNRVAVRGDTELFEMAKTQMLAKGLKIEKDLYLPQLSLLRAQGNTSGTYELVKEMCEKQEGISIAIARVVVDTFAEANDWTTCRKAIELLIRTKMVPRNLFYPTDFMIETAKKDIEMSSGAYTNVCRFSLNERIAVHRDGGPLLAEMIGPLVGEGSDQSKLNFSRFFNPLETRVRHNGYITLATGYLIKGDFDSAAEVETIAIEDKCEHFRSISYLRNKIVALFATETVNKEQALTGYGVFEALAAKSSDSKRLAFEASNGLRLLLNGMAKVPGSEGDEVLGKIAEWVAKNPGVEVKEQSYKALVEKYGEEHAALVELKKHIPSQ